MTLSRYVGEIIAKEYNQRKILKLLPWGASDISNKKIGNSDTRLPFHSNVLPVESFPLQNKHSNPESTDISSNGNKLFAYPNLNHHTPPESYVSEITSPPESRFHHPSFETNPNNERGPFPTSHPYHLSGINEHGFQPAFSSGIHSNANLRDPVDHKGHDRKEKLSHISETDFTTTKNPIVFENLEESFIPSSGTRSEPSPPNVHSAFYNGENAKETHRLESPQTNTEFNEQGNNPSVNRHHDFNLNRNPWRNGIETESGFSDQHSNINRDRFLPKIYNEHAVPEDPDVSTNVLEIPKITKKFENIGNQVHSNPITQTNEDVHDVFEGFFNLSKNHPLPDQENFHNPYFIPSESNRGRISDNSYIHSYPIFPHLSITNNSGNNHRWRDNASPFSNSEITFSTDNPILTTNTYDNYNRETTPPNYSNQFPDSVAVKANQRTVGSLPVNFAPREIVHNSRKWDDTSLRPVLDSNKHENIFNKATDTYFSTLTPLNRQSIDQHLNHRSDIPSETDHNVNIESITFSSIEEDLSKPTKQPSSHVSLDAVREGVPSHQIRFQNAFRNYKPDEIIIDVEKIPTQPPPDSTLRLQSRVYPGDEYPNRRISPTLIRPLGGQKNEQVIGETWQGRPIQIENYPRANNLPIRYRNGASFQTRKNNLLLHHPRNDSNQPQHRQQHDNNIQKLTYPNHRTASQQVNSFRPYHQMNNLPPGVSMHPRHPKAPYAEMFHSNMPPSVAQGINFRTLKPHRQRHHKKKERLPNSCCRTNGGSCCRSGGSCCTSHRGRALRVKQPCCSSTKLKNEQPFPARQNHIVVQNRIPLQQNQVITQNRASLQQNQVITQNRAPLQQNQMITQNRAPLQQNQVITQNRVSPWQNQAPTQNKLPSPQQVQKTVENQKDRCQKEKLCRTLYESTQQVMVCRNAQIDSC
ncbi:uncharacterized protein NPIL_644041 [Nephila pilipes]|uniref:Uncharacterized protein n=1 Tax=Nephila pilipes TaxID=299642 RepID=A0A8X6Q548_NEPPI|nr:uncharacterized protein NPIL_644041 [Nephila pilipes]